MTFENIMQLFLKYAVYTTLPKICKTSEERMFLLFYACLKTTKIASLTAVKL